MKKIICLALVLALLAPSLCAADADANGEATLSELFNYVAKRGNDYPFEYDGTTYYQHVQVYPKDSDYGLFRR